MNKSGIPENLIIDPIPDSLNNNEYFENNILKSSKIPFLVFPECGIKKLAEKYAPIIYFHKEETYFPCDPTEFFKKSELWYRTKEILIKNIELKNISEGSITNNLNCQEKFCWKGLFKKKEGFYLTLKDENDEFKKGIKPQKETEDVAPVYYSFHLAQRNHFLITYWFFYAYNDFINKHEGDWEGIDLKFQAKKTNKGLEYVLKGLFYHAHNKEKKFEEPKEFKWGGGRPLVFVGTGSHASKKGKKIKDSNNDSQKSSKTEENSTNNKEIEKFIKKLEIEELIYHLEILSSGDQDLNDCSSIADLKRSKEKLDEAFKKMEKILTLGILQNNSLLSDLEDILLKVIEDNSSDSQSELKNMLSIGTKSIREQIGNKYCWDSLKNLKALTSKLEWVKFGGLWGKPGKIKDTSGPFSPYHKFEKVSIFNIEDEASLSKYPILLFS